MPDDDLPLTISPSIRRKNVKGLVLQPCGGGGGKRRVLKKVRKPEAVRKSSDEDTIQEEEEEEAKLPLGGAPPVKLGRMSVDQPTMNMGGGRHAENAGSFFQVSRSILLSSFLVENSS